MRRDNKFFSRHLLIALICAIVGILCMWQGNAFVSNVGSVLLISGIYTIIDNMILKESLIEMVVQKVNLKKEIDETGLIKVGFTLTDIPYSDWLGKASKNIDIIHNYGRTWTTNNLDFIKEAIIHKKCKVRVALLNPQSEFVSALEKHYDYPEGQLVKLIKEAIDTWKKLYGEIEENRKSNKNVGTLEIYYFNGQPTNSLYRIDDKLIVVSTKNSKSKSIYLPYSVYQKNSRNGLYTVYLKEIEDIMNDAIKVGLVEAKQ